MQDILQGVESALVQFATIVWGPPLVLLLVGGGLVFLLYSRGLPYRYFGHALQVLRGRYDSPGQPGHIPHFQSLCTALSGTLGLGNIAGVAIAIGMGGPGAIFWMWVTAVVGVATKFFTATLAVMYRGHDSLGVLQGGPMYVIREALGPRWQPLAILFAVAALFGTLPVFQVNQLVQILRDMVAVPHGLASADNHLAFDLGVGLVLAALVVVIAVGNISRVGQVTARLVPAMVLFYLLLTGALLALHAQAIPAALWLIVSDAFTGQAAAGGLLGAVIVIGVRRGAFSNEAGIGTESLAHGAARTDEPVREGLVAMLGPVIDTLVVCTCTALLILVTGVWQGSEVDGVTLTARAFQQMLPGSGGYLLVLMVFFLSLSTIISFWYYGSKCLGFLVGAQHQHHYIWFYVVLIVVGALVSLDMVINLIDGMYALMAIPTMISALVLAPRVMREARRYFATLEAARGSS